MVEQAVIDVWSEELGLRDLPLTTGFFDLGGNSLSALRIVERLESRLGIEIDILDLVDADGVRAFALLLQVPGLKTPPT